MIGSFDSIVFLTNTMMDKYKSKFVDLKCSLNIVYNGRTISDNLHLPIPNEEEKLLIFLKENYIIIGSHCFCSQRKGLDQVIQSLVYLSNYCFVHIGNGHEVDKLISLSTALGVNDRCFFLGFKSNAESYIDYFDIYAMTSISEGFPLALLEAGQKGIPIVCSNISIFKELFNDNEVSYFELNDIDNLTYAILKAFEFKEFFGMNIRNSILKKYSVELMGKKYLDLYNS
jgi:glycosyltransferase involved in cell wall biosynthesis